MMHSPLLQIPPTCLRKIVQTLLKIFQMLPFPEKEFDYHPPKFLMTFFSHRLKILNSPSYFRYFNTFPHISRKLLFPLLFKISLCFRKIYVFFTYFICFSFPPSLTMMHLCITQCT